MVDQRFGSADIFSLSRLMRERRRRRREID
jgi:hypothetical protein